MIEAAAACASNPGGRMDESKLGEKLDMLDHLAEKRNALLKEKHKCLRDEVLQLKELFTAMKEHSGSDYAGMGKRLTEAECRLERKVEIGSNCNEEGIRPSSNSGAENGNFSGAFWVKEKMKEMEENLAQFQQSHHQVAKENNLIIEELEIAKCCNVKRPADAADTRALESAKKALQGRAKGKDEKNDTTEVQLLVGDAVATVNELSNALQQAEPLKQVVDTANGHFNATIERLNHRIKDLESEQSRAFSYELRLKDALQTVSRLSDENDGLKQDLKSAASRYIAAEEQLLESFDSIKELKHVVSDLSNRLRRPQGGDLLEDRNSSSLLWKKIAELEREVSTGQDKLQDAMSTIAQLKASKASLLRALNEAELMREMYVTANDQLKQANQIIEQLTERLNEIESDLNSERDKTRNKLRDTVASIDRVNFRLKSSHALRLKNSTELPPDASTDILSMITILNSRLCVLEQELSEQDLRRKVESPTRHSEQYPDCFMKIDGSLVRRAREEYKLLCSEIAEIESKKQAAAATLKSLDESIYEKRKALQQSQRSVERTLSGLENNADDSKKLAESKPSSSERKLLAGESSGTKASNACKSIQTEHSPPEKERHLSGHGLVWEFDQNRKRVQVPRKKKRDVCV